MAAILKVLTQMIFAQYFTCVFLDLNKLKSFHASKKRCKNSKTDKNIDIGIFVNEIKQDSAFDKLGCDEFD